MNELLQLKPFGGINFNDPFFDSLKNDYKEIGTWFQRKAVEGAKAYIYEEEGKVVGFLYPKLEEGEVNDVKPVLPSKRRLKIGTFKIEAHGTKLGDRFLKKIFDLAIYKEVEEIYVTVFPKHEGLIRLFEKFGFKKVAIKETANGIEDVYGRSLKQIDANPLYQYPYFTLEGRNKYLLAIYPEFHTALFSESILKTERDYDVVKDVSHTNSIEKIYVGYLEEIGRINPGDLLLIYRTTDKQGPAEYRSVATSICTVEEVKSRSHFPDLKSYVEYCERLSIFDQKELVDWWHKNPYKPFYVIKMVYNAAFSHKVIRKTLIEQVGLEREAYWGLMKLDDNQFEHVLQLGGVEKFKL